MELTLNVALEKYNPHKHHCWVAATCKSFTLKVTGNYAARLK